MGGDRAERVVNVNVGVMGHVDSGKTSLVAALSTTLSTAALDKHPQSRARGITLDLGFSSFRAPRAAADVGAADGGADDGTGASTATTTSTTNTNATDALQITLVDCPGHASLLRTVVGGAAIVDAVLLVVDVTRGIQVQTAECLVVAEATTRRLAVALNKIDLLPPEKRARHAARAARLVATALAATRFAGAAIVPVAARPAGNASNGDSTAPLGLDALVAELVRLAGVPRPPPPPNQPFLLVVDHCFAVKGHGTVLTGTVAAGAAAVGDALELPALRQTRRIKSIQAFRRPVAACAAGDRVGVCVAGLDAGALERGLAAAPGSVPTFRGAVALVEKVRFFAGVPASGARLHVIVGHATVMARLEFFGLPDSEPAAALAAAAAAHAAALEPGALPPAFEFGREYLFQEELYGHAGRPPAPTLGRAEEDAAGADASAASEPHRGPQWALLRFDEPVTAPLGALLLGARLDADAGAGGCRVALSGRLAAPLDPSDAAALARLRVYKLKGRAGAVERGAAGAGGAAVCRGMFGRDADVARFAGMRVTGPAGVPGVIEGAFGKSGKFRVRFEEEVAVAKGAPAPPVRLEFKRFLYGDKRAMAQ